MLVQELFTTLRSYEVIMDIIVFPIMSVILFGFLSVYLTGLSNHNVAYALITGMLLWQVVFIVQYSVAVGSLWNIWSRNLSNIFISPITTSEYLMSQILSGIIKAFLVFGPSAILTRMIFGFNIFNLGPANLGLYLVNLILFAISIGIVILGLIFRFGTRIQAFAWGLLPIIQPLSAAFYPVSVLPDFLKPVAYIFPATYVFEALRASTANPVSQQWEQLALALTINLIYLFGAVKFFHLMLRHSKTTGMFARLEG